LRAALDWSYELLSPAEQALFRQLSVFVGGCSLEAVEAVCAGDGVPAEQILDLLSQLVDKSLVVTETVTDGDVRYRLLETIRQYADGAAGEHGEVADVAHRHAGYFNRLAEQAETQLLRPNSGAWLDRLALERDNLRAALRWSTENGQTQQAVRIGTMLWETMEHVLAEAESARPAAPDAINAKKVDGAATALAAGPLSAREREVAVLLARGFTNRQLAETLVIAEGTAERHVANILNKLSLSSRAQAAVWAVEHGLLVAVRP
jgi:DNA-binding CsgD family transcriptional regulator